MIKKKLLFIILILLLGLSGCSTNSPVSNSSPASASISESSEENPFKDVDNAQYSYGMGIEEPDSEKKVLNYNGDEVRLNY